MDTSALEAITLEGGPRQRGLQHGEMLREKIVALLDRWAESLDRVYGISRDLYVRRFFAETAFEAALSRHTPRVLEEITAIAEGASIDYRTLLAFQHVNEEFWLALPRPAPAVAEACSTIALGQAGPRPTLIGQNLDLDQYLDGFQVMLRYRCDESDGQIMALSVPGMISLNGMNSFGFAVCDNALTQLKADVAGVPIFAIYRSLLESRSLAEATERLGRYPHASGLNWVMGDPTGVAMLECSTREIARYGPTDPALPIYHTNHPLKSRDLAPEHRDGAPRRRPTRSTYLRFAALHERITGLEDELSIEAIKAILASRDDPDYPVSRGGGHNEEDQQIGFTLACCIFELSAEHPRLHIAAGPPHDHEFRTFDA
jgi:isopenicillin-N N-acyltransferase-like protein